MQKKYLLSIDGGGIKGIIPLCLLAKLEKVTGKRTRDIFSFIAGTSTGAVITGGLAAGIPAQQLLTLYLQRLGDVFAQKPWSFLQRLFFGHMYSIDRLHAVIEDEIGEARNWTLNQVPVDILITAKRVFDGKPWYFVKDDARNSRMCGGIKLTDCMTASAAAPTYFQPWVIHENLEGNYPLGALVDGSVGVTGNPVYQACVEAFFYTEGYTPENTVVVSLGTGRSIIEKQPSWLGAWLRWVLHELLESPGEQQTEIVHRHFPQMPLYRIDPDLGELDPHTQPIALDDLSSVDRLHRYGLHLAKTVDWKAILEGKDQTFLIHTQTAQWYEYKAS